MKIVSVTTVKNESDIIESFVRYTLNIVDLMIIMDNESTDDTLNILNQLKKEKLPLIILEDDGYHEHDAKINSLVNKAVYDYNADIICPLDVDEFIITLDGSNPRVLLEKMDFSSYYLIKWRNFVPWKTDNDSKFIPSKLVHHFSDEYERYYKVIFPKELVLKYNIKVTMGNHDLKYDKDFEKNINSLMNSNLRIAHYPLRSNEQTMSKILIGWPNMLSRTKVNKSEGTHWESIFNKIKNKKKIVNDDLINFATVYTNCNIEEGYGIELNPINLDYCENLDIKYDYDYSYWNNLLENYLYFSNEIHIFKNKIIKKDFEINNLENKIKKKNDEIISLKEKIEEYHESNSWKITEPFRNFINFFKSLK